jgi:holliday junction DNA helicase RuvA
MIAGLRGTIETKTADSILVETAGVIYRVGTSGTTLNDAGDAGDPIRLHTHLIVREDQLALFGFSTIEELQMFETLIGVSGVGPRLACAVLTQLRPDALALAILDGNVELLATAPGIGKKTAARLVVELRGKVPDSIQPIGTATALGDDEVLAALRALGYTPAEAHSAIVRAKSQPGTTIEERVVAALRELSEG